MEIVGIDAGGSLLKIAYVEHGRYRYKWFPIDEMDQALSWMKRLKPAARYRITGGRAAKVKEKLTGADVTFIPEFDSVCIGTRELLVEEGKEPKSDFLIVSIGTGTSFFLMKGERYERLLGSGIGGGVISGLSRLILQESNFYQIVDLAKKGDRSHVDLLVKDLYGEEAPPILGDLTAANFGNPDLSRARKKDAAAALFQLIGETIVLLAKQCAELHQVNTCVYVGAAISQNPPLQQIIQSFDSMTGLQSIFLSNGSFTGALGAILYQ
ncbi:type II pantothenate kinase [Aeribacillus pallidus]|jgi:type II pantothenate kinase|uniref:type II pantothenate kinase n=1 Tax=Aeribacillus TaxID=1055323 RepID=UPI0007B4E5B3|nr:MULTISPECIES: type II pantothenate kinase [Aeribacillus]KZM56504.1 hypothetical protein A3Q35_08270 [Aeribacillus pallidus]MED0651132.1 type II pantothenate kinase [Aeribacillus composti]MED4487586.1 type II pantothenate kinase [Aeribacillus pallidus]BBU40443.1 type II pantothenate kinase [Aeribacillus pallidus]